jgi:hypothetical protein
MSMLLFVESMLWSIISELDFVVSSVVRSAQALLSFHMPTGKLGSRPAEIPIPAFGDAEQGRFPSRGMLTGHESQPRSELAPILEAGGITHGGHQGRGCQRPNPSQLR